MNGPARRRGAGVGRLIDPLTDFIHKEVSGGIVLVLAAAAALVWANVAPGGYESTWLEKLELGIGDASLELDLRHWVNDALMAIFFFVVGLEIKRELVTGELRDRRAATLPVVAAVGGVAVPALIFVAITAGTPEVSGWAIPAATDIAFALGVLALLGDRIPAGVKLLLLTVAIVDDIAAIVLIAVFYSDDLASTWLLAAASGLAAIVVLRRVGVTRIWPYVPLGVFVWVAVHESGVHATLAGVALGLLTPTGVIGGRRVLEQLEHRLHPVSAFAVVPLFALANAGVNFGGEVLENALNSRLAWAIAAALVLGKVVGIAGGTFIALRRGWGTLPAKVATAHIWGLAALGGIGFTVSLFIAQLAYDDPAIVDTAKVGIFAGSLIAGMLGTALLLRQTDEPTR